MVFFCRSNSRQHQTTSARRRRISGPVLRNPGIRMAQQGSLFPLSGRRLRQDPGIHQFFNLTTQRGLPKRSRRSLQSLWRIYGRKKFSGDPQIRETERSSGQQPSSGLLYDQGEPAFRRLSGLQSDGSAAGSTILRLQSVQAGSVR
jgi:hypothetical protein